MGTTVRRKAPANDDSDHDAQDSLLQGYPRGTAKAGTLEKLASGSESLQTVMLPHQEVGAETCGLDRQFCVYTHSIGGKVFYVGQGNSKRPTDFNSRNHFWRTLVAFHGEEAVRVEIVGWYPSDHHSRDVEQHLIRALVPVANFSRLRRQERGKVRQGLIDEVVRQMYAANADSIAL